MKKTILNDIAESRKRDFADIRKAIEAIKYINEIKSASKNKTVNTAATTNIANNNNFRTQIDSYRVKGTNNRIKLSKILMGNFSNSYINIIGEIKLGSPSGGKLLYKRNIKDSINQNLLQQLQQLPMSYLDDLKAIIKQMHRKNYELILANKESIMFNTIDLASLYSIIMEMIEGGVSGFSILTEPRYFNGNYGNLYLASCLLPNKFPILLKDFIIDDCQMELGYLCGASNGLLITSLFESEELFKKVKRMIEIGLEPLIEIHSIEDLEKIKILKLLVEENTSLQTVATKIDYNNNSVPFVIGINNRNLKDLTIDFNATISLVPKIKKIFGDNQPIITESGIFSFKDIIVLKRTGILGALVGTGLIKPKPNTMSIRDKAIELNGKMPPFIKVCGIIDPDIFSKIKSELLEFMTAFGAIYNVPYSPRTMNAKQIIELFKRSPNYLIRTIVSKDKDPMDIIKLAEKSNTDLIQFNFNMNIDLVYQLSHKIRKKILFPIKIEKHGVTETLELLNKLPNDIFGVILDSSEGKGKLINTDAAKKIVLSNPTKRIILAGGITSSNAFQIYNKVRPFGLDVSSSLESKPGVKDPNKINEFLEQIKNIKKIHQTV
ncbi:MAG: hypothetical protein ACTSRZ_14450 [Promethearchaeota archaeon]